MGKTTHADKHANGHKTANAWWCHRQCLLHGSCFQWLFFNGTQHLHVTRLESTSKMPLDTHRTGVWMSVYYAAEWRMTFLPGKNHWQHETQHFKTTRESLLSLSCLYLVSLVRRKFLLKSNKLRKADHTPHTASGDTSTDVVGDGKIRTAGDWKQNSDINCESANPVCKYGTFI